jgi:hypothetical protein
MFVSRSYWTEKQGKKPQTPGFPGRNNSHKFNRFFSFVNSQTHIWGK